MPDTAAVKTNRLINEKSPYLLQHAHNPVDWYPWGEEALGRAAGEDRPVFLSIGYSTCHWCHVMARECFEDEQVAELLNRHYISIKVDREERPDLDRIYMAACQAMIGSGGWPLTIIMTPDQKPFFAGTYFPKEKRWGQSGLLEILGQMADAWKNERENINSIGSKVIYYLQNSGETGEGTLNDEILKETYLELKKSFDQEYGGFGLSTKFPLPHHLLFLLRYWKFTGEKRALEMVTQTLFAMAGSALYDQLGFGFHRYATDRKWSLPHFEKTLYDNALLAYLYGEAFQATGEKYFHRIAREIFIYINREMTSPEKGFYSAEDADSEGLEGEFYLWTPKQVMNVLGQKEGEIFNRAFGISTRGNLRGKSIPNPAEGPEETEMAGCISGWNGELLNRCREKLFAEREKRVHPGKDDKILTSWNGLMIAALAKGSRVLRDKNLAKTAVGAAKFVLSTLQSPRGRLLASYRGGHADHLAYVDDYAFLSWGLLELYETGFESWCLRQAIALSRQMLSLFWDDRAGGLFFSGSDGEELIVRSKEIYDGSTPSGNAVAAYNLLRLARLTGDKQFEEKGRKIFSAFAGEVNRNPSAHVFLMLAELFAVSPPVEIIILGDPGAGNTREMIDVLNSVYLPHKTVILYPGADSGRDLTALVPFIEDLPIGKTRETTAYLCRNFTCQRPIKDVNILRDSLKDLENIDRIGDGSGAAK